MKTFGPAPESAASLEIRLKTPDLAAVIWLLSLVF